MRHKIQRFPFYPFPFPSFSHEPGRERSLSLIQLISSVEAAFLFSETNSKKECKKKIKHNIRANILSFFFSFIFWGTKDVHKWPWEQSESKLSIIQLLATVQASLSLIITRNKSQTQCPYQFYYIFHHCLGSQTGHKFTLRAERASSMWSLEKPSQESFSYTERSFFAFCALERVSSAGAGEEAGPERPDLRRRRRRRFSFSAEIWSFGPEDVWDFDFDFDDEGLFCCCFFLGAMGENESEHGGFVFGGPANRFGEIDRAVQWRKWDLFFTILTLFFP